MIVNNFEINKKGLSAVMLITAIFWMAGTISLYAQNTERPAAIKKIEVSSAEEIAKLQILLQAATLDKAGSTNSGYECLLAFQVKTPDDAVRDALVKYGSKLKKNKE